MLRPMDGQQWVSNVWDLLFSLDLRQSGRTGCGWPGSLYQGYWLGVWCTKPFTRRATMQLQQVQCWHHRRRWPPQAYTKMAHAGLVCNPCASENQSFSSRCDPRVKKDSSFRYSKMMKELSKQECSQGHSPFIYNENTHFFSMIKIHWMKKIII